jgi:hypothetical protein
MGAYDWTLWDPAAVGRSADHDVMLLEPHTKFIGGGATTVGIVSSIAMAQHPFHYVGEFDVPMTCGVDAVHQMARLVAVRNKLVRNGNRATISSAGGSEEVVPPRDSSQESPRKDALGAGNMGSEMEGLHCLAWTTQSPKPYLPLEVDLPFNMQMSRPQVFVHRSEIANATVGRPFVEGVPMMQVECSITQGQEHYLYDEAMSARPLMYWSQRNSRVLDGEFWFVRDEHLVNLSIAEALPNPFVEQKGKKGVHDIVPPTPRAAARLARYKQAADATQARAKGKK